jgi:beta-N-acetylglucosaminidase
MITFVISSFLFINNVSADYEATALNKPGAKCELLDESTGFCFYKDENLTSFVDPVKWLDNGDEVTVLTEQQSVPSKNLELCPDYYVYASFRYNSAGREYRGYYCNAYLTTSILTEEMKKEFTDLGFPESYHEKLAIIKKAHPEWEFKAINTRLDFSTAVKSLNIAGASLIQLSVSNEFAYLDIDSASFDYYNDRYIPYDSKNSSNAWYNANYDTIAYYLDPRNFLMDMYIFQFEGLSYDNSISDEMLTNTINEVFKNDYLIKYTNDFINAGKESKVSSVYLASLSRQEVGGSPNPNSAISGTVPGYEGYYNFYNIGAYSGDNPVINGLSFAKGTDILVQRPWDTEYKAIVGGALWIANNYISFGQNTSYFKKWNVVYDYLVEKGEITNPYANFTHQYMTNIMAPSSEATTTYKSYNVAGIADSKFIFYIPVYSNMPEKTNLPTKKGWPNNYLSRLSINDKDVPGFDGGVSEYNYYLDVNAKKIKINADAVSTKATITGIGEFIIPEGTDESQSITYVLKVTAENRDIKEYKINVILTGEKVDSPIDVQTTLNNAGVKNSDKYLSGFEVGTDINVIKEKVLNANSTAVIELKDSSGNEKNGGSLATGDKVIMTVGTDIKEYEVVIYGDVNGDGDINAIDYVRIRKYIMNTASLSGAYSMSADVNKDGNIDAIDYVRIRKYIMNTANIEQ